jgi:hypothetical protein|tara:strand:+ start:213 stop:347 length:135 start_codon:yes stop_codon:yes gene_type:complete
MVEEIDTGMVAADDEDAKTIICAGARHLVYVKGFFRTKMAYRPQ